MDTWLFMAKLCRERDTLGIAAVCRPWSKLGLSDGFSAFQFRQVLARVLLDDGPISNTTKLRKQNIVNYSFPMSRGVSFSI